MKTPAQIIMEKAILPTHLSSAEIREQVAAEARRRSILSARTTKALYLKYQRDILAGVVSGKIDDATGMERLRKWLADTGYVPDNPGSLTDLTSSPRLQLILDTQRTMAESVAKISIQTPDELEAFPAWRLMRVGSPKEPRKDWQERWNAAADACGWEGVSPYAMAARKDSPVWQELGDGAGGFLDTLGNPYPPFAFGSSMEWVEVDRSRARDLGITGTPDRTDAALDPTGKEIAEALKSFGPDFTDALMEELG